MNAAAKWRFWRFVRMRQQAWAHRLGRAPAVDDAALARARFTNVWRALDRGTLFSIYELLPLGAAAARVWSVVMYRAMNRTDSFLGLGVGMGPSMFQARAFLRDAAAWRRAGRPVFTGVYQSTNVVTVAAGRPPAGGMDGRLALFGEELADAAPALASAVAGCSGLEEAVALIRAATRRTRLGPFAAHQAALDLDYRELLCERDRWVHVGPGAEAALRLLGMEPALPSVHGLEDEQPPIGWAPLDAFGRAVRLAAPDVEHALCEWQKHERISAGGHAKGVYRPLAAGEWLPPAPVPPWWSPP